jgi:hypothetical protein
MLFQKYCPQFISRDGSRLMSQILLGLLASSALSKRNSGAIVSGVSLSGRSCL